jgi:hypothetical protein
VYRSPVRLRRKPQTSIPSAFMALALLSIERVSEGLS